MRIVSVQYVAGKDEIFPKASYLIETEGYRKETDERLQSYSEHQTLDLLCTALFEMCRVIHRNHNCALGQRSVSPVISLF